MLQADEREAWNGCPGILPSYEAYYDDARTLTRTTGVPSFNITAARIPAVRIPEADMEACRNRLLDAGYTVCVSDVRGASGRHMMRMDE